MSTLTRKKPGRRETLSLEVLHGVNDHSAGILEGRVTATIGFLGRKHTRHDEFLLFPLDPSF